MGTIEAEIQRRLNLWHTLQQIGSTDLVEPAVLRQLRIYGGAAGVWGDTALTSMVAGAALGIAVSLKSSGRHYMDVIEANTAIYSYPQTNRIGATDQNQIAQIEAAYHLEVPVFFIHENSSKRRVQLAYIIGVDSVSGCCIVQFKNSADRKMINPLPDSEFHGKVRREINTRTLHQIERDPKFKFNALARYQGICAVTDISVVAMLDAAHVIPVQDHGSDDARNSLLMTASAHRAFDAHLWSIDPDTLKLAVRRKGPKLTEMRFSRLSISHLEHKPAPEALEVRWQKFREAANNDIELAS